MTAYTEQLDLYEDYIAQRWTLPSEGEGVAGSNRSTPRSRPHWDCSGGLLQEGEVLSRSVSAALLYKVSIGKGSLWSIDPEYRHNLIQALKKTPYHPYSPSLAAPSTSPPNLPQTFHH
ncbi:hypothetical protein CRENBAI_005940, partial [Crenichthys baileyi]